MSWDDFKQIAIKVAKEEGYPVGVLLGQAALETGRDITGAPGNNFFGIKGQGTLGQQLLWTQEATPGGGFQRIPDYFASYSTPEDSIRAYIKLIKENYPSAWALRNNPQAMVQEIRRLGYATDPQYVSKVLNTPEFQETQPNILQKAVDMLRVPQAYAQETQTPKQPTVQQPSQYTVKPGDTLWGIAQQNLGGGQNWRQLQGYTGDPTKMPIGTQITIPQKPTPQPAQPSFASAPVAAMSATMKPAPTPAPQPAPTNFWGTPGYQQIAPIFNAFKNWWNTPVKYGQ